MRPLVMLIACLVLQPLDKATAGPAASTDSVFDDSVFDDSVFDDSVFDDSVDIVVAVPRDPDVGPIVQSLPADPAARPAVEPTDPHAGAAKHVGDGAAAPLSRPAGL